MDNGRLTRATLLLMLALMAAVNFFKFFGECAVEEPVSDSESAIKVVVELLTALGRIKSELELVVSASDWNDVEATELGLEKGSLTPDEANKLVKAWGLKTEAEKSSKVVLSL